MARKPKKREKYISKGVVGSCKKTPATGTEKLMNQLRAWKAGKPVKVSIPREYDEKGKMIGSGAPKEKAIERWGYPNAKTNKGAFERSEED